MACLTAKRRKRLGELKGTNKVRIDDLLLLRRDICMGNELRLGVFNELFAKPLTGISLELLGA